MTPEHARTTDELLLPLAVELMPPPDPVEAFRNLASRSHCLFLDSALRDGPQSRYSFLAAEPFQFLCLPADGTDAIAELHRLIQNWSAEHREDLPPFQGGAAGLFSYDLNRSFEAIPAPQIDEFQLPGLAIGFYDVVVAFDHQENRAWIVSQGFPETDPQQRGERAAMRLEQFRQWLSGGGIKAAADRAMEAIVDQSELAAQFTTHEDPLLTSTFSANDYRRTVARVVEYIRAGDVFQVNLAQRLVYPAQCDAVELYLRLRSRNAAPFAGYFDLGDHQVVSASPERFLSVKNSCIETRPIKGTRQRCCNPEADLFTASELQASAKDRAENVMIVDLLRNDLSRVCIPESVRVEELCRLETYRYVQHLVSVVVGRLAPERTPLDLIRAAFPGGSITGAPKVRAMEIIQELEPTARGAYCGSLGYIGFDGTMDLSILIRTITAGRGWWQLPVGGGIVALSDPQQEYEETWHKAVGLVRALRP